MSRPKFASRKTVDLSDQDQQETINPSRQAGGSDVVYLDNKKAAKAVKSGISNLAKVIMSIISIILVLYLSLAATLMVIAPGDTGLTWVIRNTFTGGRPVAGDFVYASSSDEVRQGAGDRLIQAFTGVKNDVVLEVVAGPHINVSVDDEGQILANEEPTGYYGELDTSYLDNEYITMCILGDCEYGEVLILPHENIAGEARGGVSTEGIGSYDSVRKP